MRPKAAQAKGCGNARIVSSWGCRSASAAPPARRLVTASRARSRRPTGRPAGRGGRNRAAHGPRDAAAGRWINSGASASSISSTSAGRRTVWRAIRIGAVTGTRSSHAHGLMAGCTSFQCWERPSRRVGVYADVAALRARASRARSTGIRCRGADASRLPALDPVPARGRLEHLVVRELDDPVLTA